MNHIWHGKTYEEWLKLWDAASWRRYLTATLIEICISPDAFAEDRLLALQTCNEAIMNGVFEPDADFPRFMRDTLLDISTATRRRSWFFFKRKRNTLHERLLGARWMLKTAYQFIPDPTETRETQPTINAPQAPANPNTN